MHINFYHYFTHSGTKQHNVRDGPVITVDGFYVRAVQKIIQYAPELPNMIQEGLKYLSKKFSNVRNRLNSVSDSSSSLLDYSEPSNLKDENFREDYIHKSFTPKNRLHLSK